MDKRTLRGYDINWVNGHHMFGIAEKVIMPLRKKNTTFTVGFERIDDLIIFITINYHKIIY